ncbi:conserved hypothetical protein [hydrothermal vent metagenome]|uniref:TIGR02646 family protein n=1 Tax=hydrothermal vent metagenome TaxID=652676 RepID=A0A1W1EJC0_9ZZZZ
MRYIQKTETPDFFINDTKRLKKWDKYISKKKRVLKEYILKEEQNYLCIYCESKINLDNSHIEHIKPKGDKCYSKLTFEYKNLSISCNGTCHNGEKDKNQYNCGHKKQNEYNKILFLNPIEIKDIREYFKYNFDDYKILASSKNSEKSNYMINTLQLNYNGLLLARKKALDNFITQMKKIKDINLRKERIKEKLNQENIEQISFLRYKYKNII